MTWQCKKCNTANPLSSGVCSKCSTPKYPKRPNKKLKKKYSRYEQGEYHPINKEKYKGTLPVLYRSSWEKAAMWWFDNNSKCISWGSESTVVSYSHNGKRHRYFIDMTATFATKSGPKKFLIEIKPYKQTIPPVKSPNKKEKTFLVEAANYSKNQSKWKAAKEFAKRKGYEFIILTEHQLFKK